MPIGFVCPVCKAKYSSPDVKAGTTFACASCKTAVLIPGAAKKPAQAVESSSPFAGIGSEVATPAKKPLRSVAHGQLFIAVVTGVLGGLCTFGPLAFMAGRWSVGVHSGELARTEPAKIAMVKGEPAKTEPAKSGAAKTDPAKPPTSLQPPIAVEGFPTLMVPYSENQIAADKKFTGNRVVFPNCADAKLEKRGNTYWLMGRIGFTEGFSPVYGVECQLSEDGAKQYSEMKETDFAKWKLVGTVKGTRPFPENIFGGFIVTIENCSFTK